MNQNIIVIIGGVPEYFGFGVSSHSYINSYRHSNSSKLLEYMEMIDENNKPFVESEEIDIEQQKFEFIMLGLRLFKGVSLKEYRKKFNCDYSKINDKKVKEYIKSKYLIYENDIIRFSENGSYIMNTIMLDLL